MIRYIWPVLVGLAVLTTTTGQASSAEATMRFRDSGMTFAAEVLGFDGKTYRVETALFGKIDLDAEKFECILGACAINEVRPVISATPDFAIHGSPLVGRYLMPFLIGGYASSIKAAARLRPTADVSEMKIELTDSQGSELAQVDLITHGTSIAFTALANGKAAIGISSRPISDAEAKTLPSVREHVLARDALLVIVSPDNPISAISTAQLSAVLDGSISDWAQLGQTAGKINVYARSNGTGPLNEFISSLMSAGGKQITPDAKPLGTDLEISNAVAGDRFGIGLASFSFRGNSKPLAISTACGVTHSPTVFNIKAGEYPYTQTLYLYKTGEPGAEHATGILNYAKSGQAQRVISGAGFIDRSFMRASYQNQNSRAVKSPDNSGNGSDANLMADLITQIKNLERLSVTFRFHEDTFMPDAQSLENIQLLAAHLSTPEMRGKKVVLLGFSDADGTFEQNRATSLLRAKFVKQAIVKHAGGKIDEANLQVKGYGQLWPVGCNDDAVGRANNRRVEVGIGAATQGATHQDIVVNSDPPANNQGQPELSNDHPEQLFRNFQNWQSGGKN